MQIYSSGKPLEMSAWVFLKEYLIDHSDIVENNSLPIWKDLSQLFGLRWSIFANSVEKFGAFQLYCFGFSHNVSATYQSMYFRNLVCLLRAVYLCHEILGNVKMTEKTEAVLLPDWKENYNNMVLLKSPAAM